jgi:hypothetical protein
VLLYAAAIDGRPSIQQTRQREFLDAVSLARLFNSTFG